ncbi:Aureobasidin resistance protein Aur1 [Mortierella sp. AD011]|nr:Aureobasidin resistance protein Aur1 [Mortierella sp. AD011]
MPGDPGGLIRVDDILGTHMYRSTFTASPLVFGAFPSLHSGCAWQLAFFTVYVFGPRSIPFALFYVFWIWWAAMYLGHHYVVDLVGGGCYAIIAFWIGSSFLPSVRSYSDMLMGSTEKQTFVQSFNHYYPIGARRSEEDWGLELNDRDMKAKEVPSDSVVMEVEEGAGGMGCDESSFQSWNGWQGYESWVMVILSARSGYSISQRVPIASTRFKDKGLFQELSNNVQQEQQEQQQQQQQQQQHEQQRQQQQQPEHVNLDYETKYITPQSPPGLVASVAEEVTASSACNVAISAGAGTTEQGRESNPGLFHARSSSDTSSSNLFMSATTAVMTSIAMTTTTTTTTTTATTTNPGVNISANKRFKDD